MHVLVRSSSQWVRDISSLKNQDPQGFITEPPWRGFAETSAKVTAPESSGVSNVEERKAGGRQQPRP
jgi:hypothetical protein